MWYEFPLPTWKAKNLGQADLSHRLGEESPNATAGGVLKIWTQEIILFGLCVCELMR